MEPRVKEYLHAVVQHPQELQALADKLGVTLVTLRRWKAGKSVPSPKRLAQLQEELPPND